MTELKCGYCRMSISFEANDDSKAHRDHIIPASRGGGDDARNCLVVCKPCNLAKSDRTPSEWKPKGLPELVYELEAKLLRLYAMKDRSKRGPKGELESIPDCEAEDYDYWHHRNFHNDPVVNALLNIARELHYVGKQTGDLIYGLKYGPGCASGGRSIAEAIEVAVENAAHEISSALSDK